MNKIIFAFAVLFLASCNSTSSGKSDASKGKEVTDTSASAKVDWTTEGANEFLDGCVDEAKDRLGDTTAYTFCKCVLEQARREHPNNMNKGIEQLNDSTQVAKYAAKCQ